MQNIILKTILGIAICSGLSSNYYRVREFTRGLLLKNAHHFIVSLKIIQNFAYDPDVEESIQLILNKYGNTTGIEVCELYTLQYPFRYLYFQTKLCIGSLLYDKINKFTSKYDYNVRNVYHTLITEFCVPKKYILLYNSLLPKQVKEWVPADFPKTTKEIFNEL